MDRHVGSWSGSSLRTVLARELQEIQKQTDRAHRARWARRLWACVPRWSRIIDVAIASTVAYFWLCL